MKLLIGFGLGITVAVFYPDIVPYIKSVFIESGARDSVMETLKNVK